MTCIYSVMFFIINQEKELEFRRVRRVRIPTPVITLDQTLWLKAAKIEHAKLLRVVLILGGFHLMMSFLGSIGNVMAGSGVSDGLSMVYGSNTT